MAAELNPKEVMQKASEKQIERAKKEGLAPSPVDLERQKRLEAFRASPLKFLEKCYIEDSLDDKSLRYFELLVLTRKLK